MTKKQKQPAGRAQPLTRRECELVGLKSAPFRKHVQPRVDGWTPEDLAKLSEDEKAWLARFNREEGAGDWRANESDRWLADWNDPAERKRVNDQLNAARRDVLTMGREGIPAPKTWGDSGATEVRLDGLDTPYTTDDGDECTLYDSYSTDGTADDVESAWVAALDLKYSGGKL